jgi:ADP-ribose pyrophosphatase YjhB (NUDIX family)
VIGWRTWQYRLSRRLGRLTVRTAALLTLGRMPSFVSASAVVVQSGRVLVVVDPIRGEPVLPGGHLKWDEDPRDAVIREVREETGLTVKPTGIVGVFAGREWAGEPGIVRIVYRAVVESGDLQSSPEGDATWMSVSEVIGSHTRDTAILEIYESRHSTSSLA